MIAKKYIVKADFKDVESHKKKDSIKEQIDILINLDDETELLNSLCDSYKFITTNNMEIFPSISQLSYYYFHPYLNDINTKSEGFIDTVYTTLDNGYYPEFTINNNVNKRFSSEGNFEKDCYLLKRYLTNNFNNDIFEYQIIVDEQIRVMLSQHYFSYTDEISREIINCPIKEVWW